MAQPHMTAWAPPQPRRRRAGRIVFWVLVGLAGALLATSVAIPIATIRPYLERSTSMEDTIVPGDQVLVAGGSGLRRGDVIVVHAPVSGADNLALKRVIGLPGDHVACCDAGGRVTVNGKPLDETYLYPHDQPSAARFSVTLRAGQVWVMGDHRGISLDSREWGPLRQAAVVGRVLFVGHGTSFVALRTPQTFVTDGLAPADTRPDFYLWLALLALASAAALLILAAAGITRYVVRRRRLRERSAVAGPV